jgi:hypothetical protein
MPANHETLTDNERNVCCDAMNPGFNDAEEAAMLLFIDGIDRELYTLQCQLKLINLQIAGKQQVHDALQQALQALCHA